MKVLFINSVYGRGSTGRIVKDLGEALEKQGHSYMVAYGRGEKLADPHCYFIGSKASVYFHAAMSRLTDRAGFYSKAATKKLVRFIGEYAPDVIHLHNLHGYYLNIEILFDYLKTQYKGKVVWTLHDCWAFTGHCSYYSHAGCHKWKTGCHRCPQKAAYPASILADNAKDNYSRKKQTFCGVPNMTIVTVSQWLKKETEQSILRDYPIKHVYNGVNLEAFCPVQNEIKQELGISKKKLVLLVSDGWDARKGYETALAVAAVAPSDWHFVMVGLTLAQIRNLPSNITGLERIWNRQKLIEYYSAADVFFNPSLEETFGLVTAEAMACGTPAVVMNSTACPELIADSLCGAVLQLGSSPESMVKALNGAFQREAARESAARFKQSKFLQGYMTQYFEEETKQ